MSDLRVAPPRAHSSSSSPNLSSPDRAVKLAKAAIAERKRRAGVELEETVVLASGGGDKDKLAITVLQRAPRRSALWKIGGP